MPSDQSERHLRRWARVNPDAVRVGAEVIYFAGYEQRERLRIVGERDGSIVPLIVVEGHGEGAIRNVSVNYLGTHYFAYAPSAASDETQPTPEGS